MSSNDRTTGADELPHWARRFHERLLAWKTHLGVTNGRRAMPVEPAGSRAMPAYEPRFHGIVVRRTNTTTLVRRARP